MDKPKYLTVSPTLPETIKINSRISYAPDSDCWVWQGGHTGDGYAAIYYRGDTIAMHRFMYAWFIEPIPRGHQLGNPEHLCLDHIVCDNRWCVNPYHLRLTTNKKNVLRGEGVTAKNAKKELCKRGHELSPRTDGPGRWCDECRRMHARNYQRRKRGYKPRH